MIEQISDNIILETGVRGANHAIIKTTEGLVMIDSPYQPSDAMRWKAEIAKHGTLRYIINTEPHGDHWTGNAFFDVPVIAQSGVRQRMLATKMSEHAGRIAQMGPEEPQLVQDYQANYPVITFEEEMTLHVGNHTFHMYHQPGHTPFQAAIVVEEEGVAFTSDNVFNKVQTFIQEGDPVKWLQSLDALRALSVDRLVPGHGDVCGKDYLDEQGAHIEEWVEYVRHGIEQGMTKEQAQENLTLFNDRYPTDAGHDGWGPRISRMNVSNLYDYILGVGRHKAS